jgi:hypothetical protein
MSLASANNGGPTSGPDTNVDAESGLNNIPLEDWEEQNRTASILLMSIDKDFKVQKQQSYSYWHANWEVYVGRFVSGTQDGIFLFDRMIGSGRMLSFDDQLHVKDFQLVRNLSGNWLVLSGDFAEQGRSQLLLYDASNGDARMLAFDPHLAVEQQKTYSSWATNLVPYVGHFGTDSLNLMLYNAQAGQSSFISFDKEMQIEQQQSVKSWDQSWQILVGSFLDRSRCLRLNNCSTGDDILVLNRSTGQIAQYMFSFGRPLKIYDNRAQGFVRMGASGDEALLAVDTTNFSLAGTLQTSIRDEELY